MKIKHFYAITGLLAALIIVLFVLHFTSNSGNGSANGKGATFANDSTATLPIAYVDVDSLLQNYNFAKDLNEALMRKEENSRAILNQKERELNSAAQEFQRLLQTNAFLSEERARQEQQRVLKMQDDYQKMAQQLAQDFALEQQKLNIQLDDTVRVRLAEYNASKGYQMILSNTKSDNLLYADEKYDITRDVVEFLNRKYNPTTAPTVK